jgi:prepilin-type N-terminal cleavage/methylation domain-containing protein
MKNKKGFTLIELLVVIAIIGILSAIVMASLTVARQKAANAKVRAQLASARSAASIYNDAHNGYNGTFGDVASNCAEADTMFTDVDSGMAQYTDLANYPNLTDLRCSSIESEFAISGSLSDPTDFWCVDSSGNSQPITGADHLTAHPDGMTKCN